MQNIKMIVSDLDSTLLNSNKEISDYSVQVLNQKQSEGIKIAFATGRPYRVAEIFFKRIKPDYCIVHNGGVIYENGNILFHSGISPEDTVKSTDLIQELNGGYADINVEIAEVIYRNCDMNVEWEGSANVYTQDFHDLPPSPAEKIIVFEQNLNTVSQNISLFPENVYMQVFEKTVGALMSKKATKLQAIKLVSEMNSIPLSQIACFGDDLNDIDMLSAAGFGVAMENALPEVKSCAGYITDTNDNDGVAKWIVENI